MILIGHRAFSLIELLIVVAIIAILAAIAVPNFLEAQTRAKVARARADMRTLAIAIEAYAVDHNLYPPGKAPNSGTSLLGPSPLTGRLGVGSRLIWITTPVAYLTSVLRDVFQAREGGEMDPTTDDLYDTFDYLDARTVSPGGAAMLSNPFGSGFTSGAAWRISSAGPDLVQAHGGSHILDPGPVNTLGGDYDPTNGTVSSGDIVLIGGGPAPFYLGARAYYERVRGLIGP